MHPEHANTLTTNCCNSKASSIVSRLLLQPKIAMLGTCCDQNFVDTSSLLLGDTCAHTPIKFILQWNLTNPNSLGPELVQISEMFGLMKQYI